MAWVCIHQHEATSNIKWTLKLHPFILSTTLHTPIQNCENKKRWEHQAQCLAFRFLLFPSEWQYLDIKCKFELFLFNLIEFGFGSCCKSTVEKKSNSTISPRANFKNKVHIQWIWWYNSSFKPYRNEVIYRNNVNFIAGWSLFQAL